MFGICSHTVVCIYSRLLMFAINNLQLMLLTVLLMKFKNVFDGCCSLKTFFTLSDNFPNFLYATRKENGISCSRYTELRDGHRSRESQREMWAVCHALNLLHMCTSDLAHTHYTDG